MRAGGNEIQPYLADFLVNLGGVTVVPGDVIFARGSAAVVIPGAEAEMILEKARMIMEKMDQMKEAGKHEDAARMPAQWDNAI